MVRAVGSGNGGRGPAWPDRFMRLRERPEGAFVEAAFFLSSIRFKPPTNSLFLNTGQRPAAGKPEAAAWTGTVDDTASCCGSTWKRIIWRRLPNPNGVQELVIIGHSTSLVSALLSQLSYFRILLPLQGSLPLPGLVLSPGPPWHLALLLAVDSAVATSASR